MIGSFRTATWIPATRLAPCWFRSSLSPLFRGLLVAPDFRRGNLAGLPLLQPSMLQHGFSNRLSTVGVFPHP